MFVCCYAHSSALRHTASGEEVEISAERQFLGPGVHAHWVGVLDAHFCGTDLSIVQVSALTILHIDWGQASIGHKMTHLSLTDLLGRACSSYVGYVGGADMSQSKPCLHNGLSVHFRRHVSDSFNK